MIDCGISGSDAAIVLPEGNIERPMQGSSWAEVVRIELLYN